MTYALGWKRQINSALLSSRFPPPRTAKQVKLIIFFYSVPEKSIEYENGIKAKCNNKAKGKKKNINLTTATN